MAYTISALNFLRGSVPVFHVDSIFSHFPDLGFNETIHVPFNTLIRLIAPSRYNPNRTYIKDRTGKVWEFSLSWGDNAGGVYLKFGISIDGVGAYENFTTTAYRNSIVSTEFILTAAVTLDNEIIFFLFRPDATKYNTTDAVGVFVNGVTTCVAYSQYTNLPSGTTLGEFVDMFSGLSNPHVYYLNFADEWLTMGYIGNTVSSYLMAPDGRLVLYASNPISTYILSSITPDPLPIIPYGPIADSQPSGGIGTYDFIQSDNIDFPSLPTLSAVSTGFVSLWSPTEEQMLRLSSFMWNADLLTVDFWKKLIANPMDLIYGLNLVPLNLSSLGYIDGTGTVVVGLINTGISMDHLSSQWVLFDCGSVDIDETWGAYLDYDPYTKLEIYLPFCGVHPLKVDDFTPGTISLRYYIDLLSGTCIAVVKSTKSNKHNDVLNSVVYQFMGNCAAQIPVTAQQFADAVRSAINIAASVGSMVATGVGGASAVETASDMMHTGASMVENVMNIKPSIERSGAIGSSGAVLAVRTPYLILTRPRMARPDSQSEYTGYPSFITETLNDLSGWTIVQAIHLDDIPCTAEEMDEIDALLKGGVIF